MPNTPARPKPFPGQGRRLKFQDKERLEPPHVTLLFKTFKWRFGLREQKFLDRSHGPGEVPSETVRHLLNNVDRY